MRQDEKDPSWWGPSWVSYRTGAGAWGMGSARHLLSLSPTIFQGCIKQLTRHRRWISGNCAFRPVAAGKVKANRHAGSKCTRYPHCNKNRRRAD
jgi:hypothetical protein